MLLFPDESKEMKSGMHMQKCGHVTIARCT